MEQTRRIIAGLLGMKRDDLRIPDSFTVAKENGMEFVIDKKEDERGTADVYSTYHYGN